MSRRVQMLFTLQECDPDYVVDVLGLTTHDLLTNFPEKLDAYLDEETPDEEEAQ